MMRYVLDVTVQSDVASECGGLQHCCDMEDSVRADECVTQSACRVLGRQRAGGFMFAFIS